MEEKTFTISFMEDIYRKKDARDLRRIKEALEELNDIRNEIGTWSLQSVCEQALKNILEERRNK